MALSSATCLSSSEVLDVLRELKEEVRRKYRSEIKGIFGSFALGNQSMDSDIDVLVEFDEGANLLDFTGVSIFLEERLNRTVDIVPEDTIRKELREGILKEVLYL